MNIQVLNIYKYFLSFIGMFLCAFVLLYTCIFTYIGVFWLAFCLILLDCSPWQGEPPMAPREPCKTDEYKQNIG